MMMSIIEPPFVFDVFFNDWCALREYREQSAVGVFEVTIPARIDELPVSRISSDAFSECGRLRKVFVPDSVRVIDIHAFYRCGELREIHLPRQVIINKGAFRDCPKLAPETVLAGFVGGADITAPIADERFLEWEDLLRFDVFELAVKYDSFLEFGVERLFEEIVLRGLVSHFAMLENAGKFPTIEETNALINLSAENGKTEMTAYLLEYKNRKFGFDFKNGGDKFEL